MKFKLFRKKKKRSFTKEETINLFKLLNEKFWPSKTFYTISLLFILDLIIIWFFTLTYPTILLTFIAFIYGLIHIILIIEFVDYKAIENFEYSPENEAYKIAKELISFIEKKGTSGTNRIKSMKKKIKIDRFYSRGYNVFYIINMVIMAIIFEILTISSLNIVLNYFLGTKSFNLQYFSILFVIGFISFIYFSFIFSIDYRNIRNLRRIKILLEIAFLRDFNNCIENIKGIISENIENINIDDLINQFNKWYTYYLGKYFEKKELNNILYDFHDFYINLEYEKNFYDLFLGIKIRFQDKFISINSTGKEKNDSKYNILIGKIDNFLNLLDHKINIKVIKKQEKDRWFKYFIGLSSIVVTLIGIITTLSFS